MPSADFTGEPLPIEGLTLPKPKAVREKSKKDEDDETRLAYRKVRQGDRKCDHCLAVRNREGQGALRSAAYMRIAPEGVVYLCLRHANERREKDDLSALRGG